MKRLSLIGAGALLALVPGMTLELGREEIAILLQEAEALFADAVEADDRQSGNELLQRAILRYERIIRDGGIRNGRLYYNLGNAYFLKDDLGRAIMNYRRAERFIPGDLNVSKNLAYARRQRIDHIEVRDRFQIVRILAFWHFVLPTRTRVVLALVMFNTAWAIAIGLILLQSPVLKRRNLRGESLLELPDDSPACASIRRIVAAAGYEVA